MTISQIRDLLTSRRASATEVVSSHFAHIRACDPGLEAFNCVTEQLGLSQAKEIDRLIASGAGLPPLAGVPVAIKDNICVSGYPTTCSSRILEGFLPAYQATVVERLSEAGAIIVGKTNMDEFAMGSSTENSAFRKTKNPWNTGKVPGGSSGGSACAVASGMSVVALGSDTGGSIRQPASFCGVVGMKPTYGVVSRFGLVAFASSLDQIGPFARCVEDAATVLQVISGHDRRDSTSYDKQLADFSGGFAHGVKGLRMALVTDLMAEGIDDEIKKAISTAADLFRALGAVVDEVRIRYLEHSLPVYYLIATAEASSNLARFDGVRYGYRSPDADGVLDMYQKTRAQGFGPEVKRRIVLGTYALSSGYYDAYYKKAQQARRLIKQEIDKTFENYDLLICPTSPSVAFDIGAKIDDPLTMYLSDIATIPANLAGVPAVSVPCGFGQDDLPIGLQIIAPPLGEATALQAAHAFEQATTFHKRQAPQLLSTSSI